MLICEFADIVKRPRVFIDLDGVCADFFTGYQRLNPTVQSEADIPDRLDPTFDRMRGTDFFYRLPKYASTDQLIATVLDFVPSYSILSAPMHGDYANCKQQKTRWVQRYLTPQPRQIIITSHKYRHAVDPHTGVPNVLIDDKQKNLRPWRETGGIGIQYHAAQDDVSVVREQLQEIFGS